MAVAPKASPKARRLTNTISGVYHSQTKIGAIFVPTTVAFLIVKFRGGQQTPTYPKRQHVRHAESEHAGSETRAASGPTFTEADRKKFVTIPC